VLASVPETMTQHMPGFSELGIVVPCLQLLEQYFGKDDELDPAGAFLKSYIANKAWKESTDGSSGRKKRRIKGFDGGSSSSEDEGDSGGGSEGGDDEGARGVPGVDDEEDEEFLEEVDRFEAAYNFRWA